MTEIRGVTTGRKNNAKDSHASPVPVNGGTSCFLPSGWKQRWLGRELEGLGRELEADLTMLFLSGWCHR